MKLITAGESHGKCLVGIIEGLPAGGIVDESKINEQLALRQQGFGRGDRMKIETDKIEVLSGLVGGVTIASPLSFKIENKDHQNWTKVMDAFSGDHTLRSVTEVRPGHADLTGSKKYGFENARLVLERASARETAVRVGAGAICRQLLSAVGVQIKSEVKHICGTVGEKAQHDAILQARRDGDTLGGEIQVVASGYPKGVGSYVQFDRKLDAILAFHLMSIQAVKAVSFGIGEQFGRIAGSKAHDEIYPDGRKTNRAGGIEGGMSNGEQIVANVTFKPIPTLMCGLKTVDLKTGKAVTASTERSDVCAVEAQAVVAENVLAFTLLSELVSGTGADTMSVLEKRVKELRAL